MRLLVVHNPSAGDGTDAAEIERVAARHGHTTSVIDPTEDWLAAAERTAPDLIVVAGGDGTVRKVLPPAANTGRLVAILPLGTANNIARALGLVVEEPLAELAEWDREPRHVVEFDVATVDDGEGRSPVVESFGGGFVAAALSSADAAPPVVDDGNEHGRRHLVDALDHAATCRWHLEIDGWDRSGDYLAVEVMNVPTVGPRLALASDAEPDDRLLDVTVVTESNREAVRRSIREHAAPAGLDTTRATTVRIQPPEGTPLHVDDRLLDSDGRNYEIAVGRRTVRVLRD